MNIIILGATGMVGEGVLLVSLNSSDVESVLVIGRKPCGIQHPKLTELVHGDFFDLHPLHDRLIGYQACFFCLGVSSVGMNEQDYTRTTYDLTMNVARTLSQLNPGMTLCYVSGKGTDSTEKGKSMWARVKGKTENDLQKLPFKAVFNFRPGFIKPIKGQKHALPLTPTIGRFYPLLKTLFPTFVCTLDHVGRAMIELAQNGYAKNIIENVDITHLGSKQQ